MTLNNLKDKPYGEICDELHELHPQAEEARLAYVALRDQVRALETARSLQGAGLWLGDRVKLDGKFVALVVTTAIGDWALQIVSKTGKPQGLPVQSFMFDTVEKLD